MPIDIPINFEQINIDTTITASYFYLGILAYYDTKYEDAKKYFKDQTKETKYQPMISKTDKPAIELNEKIMSTYRPEMKKYYYNPKKYDNYLDQLGIKYPSIKK